MNIQTLVDTVRQTAYEAHVYFKNGYLKTSQTKHGMLMNFGAPKFEVKKYIL